MHTEAVGHARSPGRGDESPAFHFLDAIDPEQLPMLMLIGVARPFDLIGPKEELPHNIVLYKPRPNR